MSNHDCSCGNKHCNNRLIISLIHRHDRTKNRLINCHHIKIVDDLIILHGVDYNNSHHKIFDLSDYTEIDIIEDDPGDAL